MLPDRNESENANRFQMRPAYKGAHSGVDFDKKLRVTNLIFPKIGLPVLWDAANSSTRKEIDFDFACTQRDSPLVLECLLLYFAFVATSHN